MLDKNDIFKRSSYKEIIDYFDDHIDFYDSYAINPYWSFSDDLLKYLLKKFIYEQFKNKKKLKIFDAGAGTGNWTKYILDVQNSSAILFDMNPKMLQVAFKKLRSSQKSRYKIIEGNLEELADYPKEKSDVIICLHSVIGLARDTDKILKNFYSYLDHKGLLILMTPNKYHALSFSKANNNTQEIKRILQDSTVRFKKNMPEMFCYTPEELKQKLLNIGFKIVKVFGFPVTIYPDSKDTNPLRKETTNKILMDKKKRKELFEIEKILSSDHQQAWRGNNLIAVAKK